MLLPSSQAIGGTFAACMCTTRSMCSASKRSVRFVLVTLARIAYHVSQSRAEHDATTRMPCALQVDQIARRPYSVPISCVANLGTEVLLSRMWEAMDLRRLYTKKARHARCRRLRTAPPHRDAQSMRLTLPCWRRLVASPTLQSQSCSPSRAAAPPSKRFASSCTRTSTSS